MQRSLQDPRRSTAGTNGAHVKGQNQFRQPTPRTLALALGLAAVIVSARVTEVLAQDGRTQAVQTQAEAPRIEQGRSLTDRLYCIACHRLPFEKEGEQPPLPAPDLTFAGDKVRPEWLFKFLKKPQVLRPWRHARMPSFWLSDEEALVLTEYLMTLRNRDASPIPERLKFVGKVSAQDLKAAKVLLSKDYFDCLNCHQQGEKKPSGPREGWAPDLALAAQRLNPDWVIRWLQDPQKIQPGTKMPLYESGPEDVLGGDLERQIIAVRNYVVSLGRPLDPTEYRLAKAKYPKVTAEQGRRIVEETNCIGCHRIAGLPAPDLKVGPDLTRRHNPVTREWLVTFLKSPEKIRRPGYLGGTRRMPNLRLSDGEAEAIAAYLMTTAYPRVEAPPSKQAPPPAGKATATGIVTVR